MLDDEEITDILLRNTRRPAAALLDAALDAGGKDNVTAVVIGSTGSSISGERL